MDKFKIRCSAIGKIMTKTFGQTAKSYCETWLKEQLYSRKKEFKSKYTDKGQIMEDDSLDFIADMLGYGMLLKNEKEFSNAFMTGTPDVILPGLVIDVKNSWDNFTFPLFETEIPNKDYYWQAQGYMALTGIDKYKLIYVLSDTPENLIVSEAKKYIYNNGIDDFDTDIYEGFKEKMTYDDIPDKLKIRVFDIDKNDADIELINDRVMECGRYIDSLLKTI